MAKKNQTEKNKVNTPTTNPLTTAVTDAAHMILPLTVLFEHPANRARIYGDEALANLEAQVRHDPRGIARNPLGVTPALDAEGTRLLAKDLCTDAMLADNPNLAAYVALHPEMRESTVEAWYITSGNHRLKVYRSIGMEQAPVVAQEMDKREQVRALLQSNNAQPLTRLEIGRYYLEEEKVVGTRGVGRSQKGSEKEGLSTRRFAEEIGRSSSLVHDCVLAARVYNALSPEAQKLVERVNSGAEKFTPDHLIALQAIGDMERRSEFVSHIIDSEPEYDEKGKPTGKVRWFVRVTPSELKAIIAVRVKGEGAATAFKAVWDEIGIEDLISPDIMREIERSAPAAEDEGSIESARATVPAAPPAAGKRGQKEPAKPLTKAELAAAKKAQKEADRKAVEAAEKRRKAEQAKAKAEQAAKTGKKNGGAVPTVAEDRKLYVEELESLLVALPKALKKTGQLITEGVEDRLLEPEEGVEYRDKLVGILDNWAGQVRALFEGEQLSLGALATAPTTTEAAAGPDGPEAASVEEEREPAAVG